MTVNSELDDILSDAPSSVETDVQAPAPSTDTTVARDESGRFAQKAAPAAAVEQPIDPAPAAQQQNGGIPVGAIQAERDKRQEAQQEAEALRREVAELRGMVHARQQPTPQQPQQQQPPASLWDDPDAYLKSQLTPVQSQMLEMREMVSENIAVQTHGAETVSAAKTALEQAARTPEGQQMVQKLMQSRHPFDELVKWHKTQSAIARVGDDPDAWLNAELEKRLSDPAEQAKILERIRNGAVANQNTGQPLTNLPPSLSRIPSGGNTAQDNDMSDGALFNFATAR